MKRINLLLIAILISVLLFSCHEQTTDPIDKQESGTVEISFNKTQVPANVTFITATLTRANYQPLSSSLNVTGENSAEILFQNIEEGIWHIMIEAKDAEDNVLFSGETDVNVVSGETVPVYLTLTPAGSGKGSIHIYVNWGNDILTGWTDYPANPIVDKFGIEKDQFGVLESYVVKHDGQYKMWYSGLASNAVMYVFHATSTDGINWTRYSQDPVIKPTPNFWDSEHTQAGPVIYENGVYKIYYTGWANSNGNWDIGYASSSDGINWVKLSNPVLEGNPNNWDQRAVATSVVKKGSTYYMFYAGQSDYHTNWRIGVATSTNGIEWERYPGNPVVSPTLNWEESFTGYPSVIYEDGLFKMVYSSSSKFGYAESADGFSWTKVSVNNPIFEYTHTVNNYVKIDYPNLINDNGEYKLFYTGFDEYNDAEICLLRN